MGLRILHYRARVIGAALNLQTRLGSGTTVTCLFLPTSRELPPNGDQPGIHAEPARTQETVN
jgi:hypothetical protein